MACVFFKEDLTTLVVRSSYAIALAIVILRCPLEWCEVNEYVYLNRSMKVDEMLNEQDL